MAAVLMLFTPRVYYLLARGWTSLRVMLLAHVFSAWRWRARCPMFLACCFRSNPTRCSAPCCAADGRPLPRKKQLAFGGQVHRVAALINLPFFIINPRPFAQRVFLQGLHIRIDALSYPRVFPADQVEAQGWIAFMRRRRHHPRAVALAANTAGFCAGLALACSAS